MPQSIKEHDARLIGALLVGTGVLYMAVGGLQASLAGATVPNAMFNTLRFFFLTSIAYALLTLGLNLHWGYTGLFNIGVAGFMAVGTYTTYILAAPTDGLPPGLGLNIYVAILGGIVAAAIVGAIVALPALQLDADYFAIVTVGFSEMIRLTIQADTFSGTVTNPESGGYNVVTIFGYSFGTGGGRGISSPMRPPTDILFEGALAPLGQALIDIGDTFGIGITVVEGLVYVAFLLFVVLTGYYVLVRRVGNSPFGRVLKAIREDETVAQSLGKDTRVFKIKVFMLGAAMMGLAGILWRGRSGYINPTAFKPIITFYVFAALIIGGAGSNTGSVVGAVTFTALLLNGPRRLAGVINASFDYFVRIGLIGEPLPEPNTSWAAISSLDPLMWFGYLVAQLPNLKFIFLGVVLVYLMQNRADGMLGHRKEIASSIDLTERPASTGDSGTGPIADGGDADE